MDLIEVQHQSGIRHPWEVARFRFFDRLASEELTASEPVAWLDVGSGDAWLAASLHELLPTGSRLTCVDAHYTEAHLEQLASTHPNVTFAKVVSDERFDVISLFDVIEHVEADRTFLSELVDRHLEPAGRVVISVPAYQALFTRHDTALRHFRRYSPFQLREVLPSSIEVVREGGLFSVLLPMRAVSKLAELIVRGKAATTAWSEEPDEGHGVGGWKGGPVVSGIITAVLEYDARLSWSLSSRRIHLPGLSCWMVCRGTTD